MCLTKIYRSSESILNTELTSGNCRLCRKFVMQLQTRFYENESMSCQFRGGRMIETSPSSIISHIAREVDGIGSCTPRLFGNEQTPRCKQLIFAFATNYYSTKFVSTIVSRARGLFSLNHQSIIKQFGLLKHFCICNTTRVFIL